MPTEIAASMRQIIVTTPGGPETLTITDVPVPQPKESEVLIRVAAAGVNRADIFQRQGKYPPAAGRVGRTRHGGFRHDRCPWAKL